MNIIVITKHFGNRGRIQLGGPGLVAMMLTALLLVPAAAWMTGLEFGKWEARRQLLPAGWQDELLRSREQVAQAARTAREDVNALAVRLGQLQAQAVRLNALGQRLVEVAKLDRGEFDFSEPPGQGGPEADAATTREIGVPDFLHTLEQLAAELDDREQQLRVLESLFMKRSLDAEILPAGRPTTGGWISSYFGMRTDPFTGRQEYHKGIDLAGKAGAEIDAVASGVVTWAGDRFGYGKMVEINHGNGYITRYAHSSEVLVKVGDVVAKGQRIALMGSTGRSTGPHVHFEVLKNGRAVNPVQYVQAAR